MTDVALQAWLDQEDRHIALMITGPARQQPRPGRFTA